MPRLSRRGSVHGRLAALEAKAETRVGGPLVGWQDPLSLAVFADGNRMYNSAAEFYEASRRGNKTGVLICRDCEQSPHSRPQESTSCPN